MLDELKVKSTPEPNAADKSNDDFSSVGVKFFDELHKKVKPLLDELKTAPAFENKTQKSDVTPVLFESNNKETEKNNKLSVDSIVDNFFKNVEPLFNNLTAKSSPDPKAEELDVADVLKGEEVEKITKVSIVNISDDALKSLSKTLSSNDNASAKDGGKGGGILSSITGLLGGAGAAAAGSGLIAFLTALPAAAPGIGIALATIVLGAAAVSAAIAIVVKTISYLKDDLIAIFPAIKNFAKLFVELAVEVFPVVVKALADFVATVLPAIINAFKEFAFVVIPAVTKAITSLIDSPGFKFLITTVATIVTQTFGVIGNVLTGITETIKSVFTSISGVLISLFENIKAIVVPIITGIKDIFTTIATSIERIVVGVFKNIRDTVVPVVTSIKDVFIAISTSIQGIFVGLFENVKETLVAISANITQIITKVSDTIVGTLDRIESIFTRVPAIIGEVLGKVKDFANEIKAGKISEVAGELIKLAGGLTALTASSLLSGIGEFFADSPFDKIIDFQNKIDVDKLAFLSTLAPNLQKLVDVNADQLEGFGSLIDELISKSVQVSATVEKLFSGESSWFKKSGGILEIVDKLESAKQGAENTISSVIVKASENQMKISTMQLNETKMTNKILNDIFKKMNTMSINASSNAAAVESVGATRDARIPLQFTSTSTRQQMVQSGTVL